MFINYSMWLTEGQGRGTNENKIVHTAFLCLFSRSGFQAQQGGTVAFAVNVGQQFSGLALNNCCNTSCQCKKALADATASSPDISTFYSKILECKNEMIQSFTFISDSNNNSGTNGPRSDDTAAARDILSSNFGDSLAETAQKCNGPVCKRLVPWDEVKLSLPKDILLLPNLSTR
ncbi:unnamed protein product [Cylindrotheca closterium]|uniref:Uncharacterized protein n=1 Tax=Cylindrotheca closterium TaxID=2856 RepID=A0AAD2FFX1_9STRA|nr:unnamed protein product [Cylindrotheca closterium]